MKFLENVCKYRLQLSPQEKKRNRLVHFKLFILIVPCDVSFQVDMKELIKLNV